ncbi:AGE family epimerase/isomerase [Nakamurella silvestris]|nr:AGE family epimerase/isomerase [Nakamurella silvestris]
MPHPSPRPPAPGPSHPALAPIDSAEHRAWLTDQFHRLVAFSRQAVDPAGGFDYLDTDGTPMPGRDRELYITCRMTYVFALAHLSGVPGADGPVRHGLTALSGLFHDDRNGGWHSAVAADGSVVPGRKEAYGHAFVLLAAATATAAGIDGADVLLDRALDIFDRHFWDDEAGLVRESFAADFTDDEPYRGANSNMHSVEALLAAAGSLGAPVLAERTGRICAVLIDRHARAGGWSLPEHYDQDWTALPEYNKDAPRHPFRPYGSTIGHWFEWARLLAQSEFALDQDGVGATAWMVPAAVELFDHGVTSGWSADGVEGFVYTLDWDLRPVAGERMHWVVTEAIAAAAALYRRTGEERFHVWYQRLWQHAVAYFVEEGTGTWRHELDADLREVGAVWPGRPDAYHAAGALLIPQLPLTASLAGSILAAKALAAD